MRSLRRFAAVTLLASAGCNSPPPPRSHGTYKRPISESIRLAQSGVTDTTRLRRWRTIDSLAASESGDSLTKLYIGLIHAPASEGQRYMNAILCENVRIGRRLGAMAGGLAMRRVADSLFSDPAIDSAFNEASKRWGSTVVSSDGCDLRDIQPAAESLSWRPEYFPRPGDKVPR